MWLVRALHVLATYAPIGVDKRYGSTAGSWSNTGSAACFALAILASLAIRAGSRSGTTDSSTGACFAYGVYGSRRSGSRSRTSESGSRSLLSESWSRPKQAVWYPADPAEPVA